jgi:alkylmercury lyase
MAECSDSDALPDLGVSKEAQRLRVDGFRALWLQRQPVVGELGADAAVIDELAGRGLIEVADDGRLLGVHGLSSRPTGHWIERAAGAIHTWCAFDAVGIPAALGIDAVAISTCPACGREFGVTLTAGIPAISDQRVWLPAGGCAHVIDEFCRHADLFCDAAHLDQHVGGRYGRSVTVAEAAQLGRRVWRDVAAILGCA